MTKAVTLLDVAKAAGVSKATVSNVFGAPTRVRPGLRDRVEAAARELGYAGPDPKGRMLSSGKVNAIGIVPFGDSGVSHFFKDPYQRAFLAGVADVCEERRIGLSLVSAREDEEGWGIKTALVDGFILTSLDQVRFAQPGLRRVPFVVMDIDGAPDMRSVQVKNRDGARQATQHLIDLGHRHFVVASPLWISRPPVFHAASKSARRLVGAAPSIMEKFGGVADALAEANLSIDDVPVVEGCGNAREQAAYGVNSAAMLLAMAPEATAVIAFSDGLALGVLDQARRRGLDVPKDLSVVGFDDSPEAAAADPPLTTIHQSAFENGRVAARILLEEGPPQQALVPVNLVVRGSTGPPRHSS